MIVKIVILNAMIQTTANHREIIIVMDQTLARKINNDKEIANQILAVPVHVVNKNVIIASFN
jgi:hypothetical protein